MIFQSQQRSLKNSRSICHQCHNTSFFKLLWKTICVFKFFHHVPNGKIDICEMEKKFFLLFLFPLKSWFSGWYKIFTHSDWSYYPNSFFPIVTGFFSTINTSIISFKPARDHSIEPSLFFISLGNYSYDVIWEGFNKNSWTSTGS